MSDHSRIAWTNATWNPVTGCTKVSPGCLHCYAARMAHRLHAMGLSKYRNDFDLTLHPDMLELPLEWKRPRHIFVNSMSDLFHLDVPVEFIQQVFETMHRAPQHVYQILTKRAQRLAELSPLLPWAPHIWAGVTVEHADYRYRVDCLRQTGAAVKYLSMEPLLGPVPNLNLTGIDLVIVGGESGPGARPMAADWVRDLRDQCLAAGVAFNFKQWGGARNHAKGRELDGQQWDEFPRLHSSMEGMP